jgi:hypothetical protein
MKVRLPQQRPKVLQEIVAKSALLSYGSTIRPEGHNRATVPGSDRCDSTQ